ncbi:MAG: hypothetical protein FE78DRAFT_337566 [Acidomyces sp. 'richmondensis']|nr:MAG: hypothetical protein FE78DRAFT_337566 [Acidomyces sp. 'richmondensis']
MATNKSAGKTEMGESGSKADEYSPEDQKKEASRTARASLEAQKKAKELTQAAAGAGDPQERQKLLNQALEKEIEAEKFGKTAKYLESGAFQGMIAGTGIGTGIGAGLGTLTGALVGGLTSIATGTLGGAAGTAAGALHGPWIKMGDLAGAAVSKVTGTIPGWNATDEQKKALEKMLDQVDEQDMPSEQELRGITSDKSGNVQSTSSSVDGEEEHKSSRTDCATSWIPSKDSLPSMPSWKSKEGVETGQREISEHEKDVACPDVKQKYEKHRQASANDGGETDQDSTNPQKHGQARCDDSSQEKVKKHARTDQAAGRQQSPTPRETTRVTRSQYTKMTNKGNDSRPSNSQKVSQSDDRPKKKPRKLEVRGIK